MDKMNSKILKALIDAGAIKRMTIVAETGFFRIEAVTQAGTDSVKAHNGKLKTWVTLDAAAKWLHGLGIGTCAIEMSRWQPAQKGMKLI
jgi:hypothetical protein